MQDQLIDPKRQELAKKYAGIRRRLMLLDLVLVAGLLIAWLLLGWSEDLRNWINVWTTNPWIGVMIYGVIFGAVFTLIDLPLSFYSGYVLPHKFGQSNQTLTGWFLDLIKNLGLTVILGGIVLELIYLLLRVSPEFWWLWTGGFLLLFNILIANIAPILLFPIFYRFSPLKDEFQELHDRLLRLAEKANIHVMGVYTFDMSRRTKSANASLTGLGNTRRIILGDTLLEEFTTDEIETVLAHEIGHHVNNDIPLSMVLQTILTLGGLYLSSLGLLWGIRYFGFYSVADLAAFPLFGLIMGMYGLITMPIGNSFSRWREYLADRFALQITGKGKVYANALTRLSNQNLADISPEPWVEFFLHSHPALSKRISIAKSYNDIND
jgi:STE24 endopeptidase